MTKPNHTRLSTGIAGLDDILHGGLAKGFLYLIEGNPGAGETTLALQFLIEGAARGEKGLYISLAESEVELHQLAGSRKVSIGDPLTNFTGVLSGRPDFRGGEALL